MKKSIITAVSIIVLLILYIITINVYFSIQKGDIILNNNSDSQGENVKLGISEKISVTTQRNSWYGTTTNDYAGNKTTTLYLFNSIKIPMEINGTNLIFLHLGFIFLLFMIVLTVILYHYLIDERREIQNVEMVA